jgi:hypothetical protein
LYLLTNPATGTTRVGLPADTQLAAFFALPFIKYTLIRNFLAINRDSYVREFYLDENPHINLPGLAKNSPALTQTATNHTGWPLAKIQLGLDYSAFPHCK